MMSKDYAIVFQIENLVQNLGTESWYRILVQNLGTESWYRILWGVSVVKFDSKLCQATKDYFGYKNMI